MTDEFTNPTNSNPPPQPIDRSQQSGDRPNHKNTQQSQQIDIGQSESSESSDPSTDSLDQQLPEQLADSPAQSQDRNKGNIELLGFRLIGYGLLALALLDVAYTAFPPRFMNPAWELEVIQALAARVPMFFVGLVMVLYQKRAPSRWLQKIFSRLLAWGIVAIACLYFLTIPLTISNSLRQDNAYRNDIKSQLFQVNTQTQQLQNNLAQASDRDILNLLNQVEDQELLGSAANPQEFKNQASEQIQQFDQQAQEQAKSALWQQRIDNVKNSLRLVIGGAVAGMVLLRIRFMAIPKTRERQNAKDIRSLNLARLPGYGLLFLGLINYLITLIPPQVTNPSWGIFSTSYIAELVPIPIIGLALIFYRSTQGRKRIERLILKILSWGSLITAILFALLVPIVITYSIQQNIQNTERLETQVEQLTAQNNQLRDRIENSSTAEIATLIEQQTLRGAPPASQDPEQLRIIALADLEQRQQNLQSEMTETKKQQNKFLLRNFFKRLAESIVISGLFFYIWRATDWARTARYGVIARRRRRPKSGKGKGKRKR